jgi:hypothetical protein
MTKPSLYPEWATDDIINTIYNTPNKSEPDATHKSLGYDLQEMPDRQYMNYQFDLINKWIKYFTEERTKIYTGNTDASSLDTFITLSDNFAHNTDFILAVKLHIASPTNRWFYLPNPNIVPFPTVDPYWIVLYGFTNKICITVPDTGMRDRPYQILVIKSI